MHNTHSTDNACGGELFRTTIEPDNVANFASKAGYRAYYSGKCTFPFYHSAFRRFESSFGRVASVGCVMKIDSVLIVFWWFWGRSEQLRVTDTGSPQRSVVRASRVV